MKIKMNNIINNPDYVYLGNNRYIEKKLYIKAIEDIKKYIPNKNFLGKLTTLNQKT